MDTITHGITGALIGKGFYAERYGRVATFAATLGAVFPDSDVLVGLFERNDLAILELHRGFTHSFVCLPFFAAGLAALTRWFTRRRGILAPGWGVLTGIYAVGLSSHILLDLITSFGTMIWSPLSNVRAAWDLVFIVDFLFTGVVLLPQVAAWVYRERDAGRRRALLVWILFSLLALGAARLARAARFPFSPSVVPTVSLLLAALFFLPAWRGWGFQVARRRWCRAGLLALAGYLALCAGAHRLGVMRVERFATSRGLTVEALGAMPMPPSLLNWSGLIRTREGVYQSFFRVSDLHPTFQYLADARANGYIEAARRLPAVKTYLWFARFPVVRYIRQGRVHTVEFTDLRFSTRGLRRRNAFTFRVTLDDAGRLLDRGWVEE